jgi:hypothetical protein
MPRGGDRSAKTRAAGKRVGRPPKAKIEAPPPDKGIASRVLARIDEEQYWMFLLHADEMMDPEKREMLSTKDRDQIGAHLERLTNRRDGSPPQSVNTSFNPDTALRVIVEHIGRPKDQASTKAESSGKTLE